MNNISPANRLINEKSPYLIQHARNPVDWYPWGDEAFNKARAENKPIFLSIGYSTCHWCHVMERESFENDGIANLLNQNFISVKVDREERPDIDQFYISVVQALTGAGGWPLSVWLTPQLKPFYGGTYFPPHSRSEQVGFDDVLKTVHDFWANDPAQIESSGQKIEEAILAAVKLPSGQKNLNRDLLEKAFSELEKTHDDIFGGFGSSPKFPMPVYLNFLHQYYFFQKNEKALTIATKTLQEMAKGGIYDHLGGGFHRYSTDPAWRLPHFEKMLYDNAQLAMAFLEGYQLTLDPVFGQVAEDTLNYLLRDMLLEEGGFGSAEDADSGPDKSEGAYYLWKESEIREIIDPKILPLFEFKYGIKPEGNIEPGPGDEFKGKNILFRSHSQDECAVQFKISLFTLREHLRDSRSALLQARYRRPRPEKDDKILTGWNGLAISALVKGAQVLGKNAYKLAADRAAQFISKNLLFEDKLSRRYREGEKAIDGMLEDYAYFIQALIDLYEATFNPQWLLKSEALMNFQIKNFYDEKNGGFFTTRINNNQRILAPVKDDSDNVLPSGNSVTALNLIRLAEFFDRKEFREIAEKTLAYYSPRINEQPSAFCAMLTAYNALNQDSIQIIIATPSRTPEFYSMIQPIFSRYLPNKTLVVLEDRNRHELEAINPLWKSMKPLDGKTTAFVCVKSSCQTPFTDPISFENFLKDLGSKQHPQLIISNSEL